MQYGSPQLHRDHERPRSDGAIAAHEIEAELQKILESPIFRRAPRHSRFLAFVVRKTLDGSAESVKEYAVGLQVFDRPADYDTAADPVVRVEAGRLRSRLADYYQELGKRDTIHIDLPKGTYVPVFSRNGVAPASHEREEADAETCLPAPPVEPVVVRRARRWWLAVAAVLAIASAVTVYFRARRPARLGERVISRRVCSGSICSGN